MANIRRDDNVLVIAGKDRGKTGKVNRVIREKDRVVVAGVNIATKHVKNRPGIRQAGIIHVEAPLHISNVMLICPNCNKPTRVDYGCIPSAVFSHPPLAGVGLTEGAAREKLGQVRTYTSDFRAMKNVLAGRNERSLYKLVVDGATDEIVGIHMIGPDAPEILQAAAVAVKAKLKKADFDQTVALHPTMAEELVLMR